MPTTDANKFDSDASAAPTSEADTPRAWWFAERSQEFRTFRQYEETLVYLRGILEKQHFDGVFGFSQGAACAAILAALCENPQLDPVFAKPSEDPNVTWPPPPFKFAILSAGFFPLDPRTSAYFETPLKTPTLHVLGRADTIVGEERSVPLTKVFHDARVEWHDGGQFARAPGPTLVWIKASLADPTALAGHHTPSKASWRRFFQSYMEAFDENGGGLEAALALPSPSAGSAADTPSASGTTTPTATEAPNKL